MKFIYFLLENPTLSIDAKPFNPIKKYRQWYG